MDERGPGPVTLTCTRTGATNGNGCICVSGAILNREADIATAISQRQQQQLLAWRREDCA